jgi:hypothetical protein
MSAKDLKKMLESTNTKISKLTKYGERTVTTQNVGNILEWSNSLKKWKMSARIRAGTHTLDANEVAVDGDEHEITQILPFLNDLPLFKKSYEGRGGN